jgi:uncharacterized protein (TIGR02594 family)
MTKSIHSLLRILMVDKNISASFSIGASVGDWSRGAKNAPSDVKTVQLLLEHISKMTGQKEFNPQGVDGKISQRPERSNTVKAIRAYQRGFLKNPDGVVDPDGRTFEKLKEAASGGNSKSKDTSRAIMQAPHQSDGYPPWLYRFNGFSFFNPFSLLSSALNRQPNWISIAEDELGTEEDTIDNKHNPRIIEYHATTTLKAKEDETAWCSSFVNWVMEKSGYAGTNSASSHSWKNWGDGLSKPAIGAIAFIDWGIVYAKKKGKGHVGFVVGKDSNGRIVLLGGNQSDSVRYTAFKASHISSYRVPKGYQLDPAMYDLPVLKVTGGGSGYEATR